MPTSLKIHWYKWLLHNLEEWIRHTRALLPKQSFPLFSSKRRFSQRRISRWRRHFKTWKASEIYYIHLYFDTLKDAFLPVWSFQQPWWIIHPPRLTYQSFPQHPAASDPLKCEMWNVWFLALSAWQRAPSPKHLDPNGCPEFSSVTLAARNNGQQMLESFAILMLTLKFV